MNLLQDNKLYHIKHTATTLNTFIVSILTNSIAIVTIITAVNYAAIIYKMYSYLFNVQNYFPNLFKNHIKKCLKALQHRFWQIANSQLFKTKA